MRHDNQHSLKDVLNEVVDSLKWKEKLHETKIRALWTSKMGTTINNHTSNIKLRKHKIFISINSAPLKHELSFQRDKIIELINHELGENYVKDVIIL